MINWHQEDSDGDGYGDACDGPEDADGDPRLDLLDNCPNVWNSSQADLDGDELGDACDIDMDGDRVLITSDFHNDGDFALNKNDRFDWAPAFY